MINKWFCLLKIHLENHWWLIFNQGLGAFTQETQVVMMWLGRWPTFTLTSASAHKFLFTIIVFENYNSFLFCQGLFQFLRRSKLVYYGCFGVKRLSLIANAFPYKTFLRIVSFLLVETLLLVALSYLIESLHRFVKELVLKLDKISLLPLFINLFQCFQLKVLLTCFCVINWLVIYW